MGGFLNVTKAYPCGVLCRLAEDREKRRDRETERNIERYRQTFGQRERGRQINIPQEQTVLANAKCCTPQGSFSIIN